MGGRACKSVEYSSVMMSDKNSVAKRSTTCWTASVKSMGIDGKILYLGVVYMNPD